jgi:ABC-type lipoprotein export system ATPase subunit
MSELIEIKGLKKDFSNAGEILNILKGVDFDLGFSETVSIMGESGSGKSTFLNLIGGLDSSSSGSILFEGNEITELAEDDLHQFRNKKIGFIFQSHYLLEEFDAVENVMIPYLMNTYNKREARERSCRLLEAVGMGERLTHHPSQLSGGEKQRIAIARAFINDPPLILADEPTGNLDEKNSGKVLELLFGIASAEKRALIMVTHSKHISGMTMRSLILEDGILKNA